MNTIQSSGSDPYSTDDDRDLNYEAISKKVKRENLVHYFDCNHKDDQQKKIKNKGKAQPQRKRNRPDRFGKRTSTVNHDEFFMNMEMRKQSGPAEMLNPRRSFSQRESLVCVETVPSSSRMNTDIQFETSNQELRRFQSFNFMQRIEKSVMEMSKTMTAEMSCLKIQIARIEARLTDSLFISNARKVKQVDDCNETASDLGLPIQTKQDLDDFETRVKESPFESKVVSTFRIATVNHVICTSLFQVSVL